MGQRDFQSSTRRSITRTFALLFGGLTLAFLAVVIFVGLKLRHNLRAQVMDSQIVLLQSVNDWEVKRQQATARFPGDFLGLALSASDIEGVVSIEVYSLIGDRVASVPPDAIASTLDPAQREKLAAGEALSTFHADVPLDALFELAPLTDTPIEQPMLEVWIPLPGPVQGSIVAFVRYWLDGREMASRFAALDRNLVLQALVIFSVGVLVLATVLGLGMHQVRRLNAALAERTRELEQANSELSFAARASAVGAISSHLIHGLKGSLAGLNRYLRAGTRPDDAAAIAARMQQLVQEAVSVIRQENGGHTTYTMQELVQQMERAAAAKAGDCEVAMHLTDASAGTEIGSKVANLATCIIVNLVENAADASAPGQRIEVRAAARETDLIIEVVDQAGGIPESMRDRLFQPGVTSRTEGGTGLGLAISRLLARHLGGDLRLSRSDEHGSTFVLTVPDAFVSAVSAKAKELGIE